jgi:hypothetical protein
MLNSNEWKKPLLSCTIFFNNLQFGKKENEKKKLEILSAIKKYVTQYVGKKDHKLRII